MTKCEASSRGRLGPVHESGLMIFMNHIAAMQHDREPVAGWTHNRGTVSPLPDPSSAARPALHASGRGWGLRLKLNAIVAGLMGIFVATLMWLQIEATRASVREEIIASNRVATQLLERVSFNWAGP